MTKFRDRLRRLHDAHHRGKDTQGGPSGVYRAEEISEADEEAPNQGAGWQGLGASQNDEYGQTIWIATERCDDDTVHGDWRFEYCREVPHRKLANLQRDVPQEIRRTRILYMDTETTGLGEHSLAFMIGLGFWEPRQFVVEQLMVEAEEDEPALLEAFRDRLQRFDVLVTFNGKGFDVPLLTRRYEVHGMDTSFFDDVFHLDLLPLSRRVFPGLNRYKLTSLEKNILHFERVDDVPGREIPKRWWKFKKNHNAQLMAGVLEHNRHDVVSMMTLVAHAIAGECPRTAQKMEEESRRRRGLLGFGSRTERTERTERKDEAQPPDEEEQPTEGIAKRLERAYRLRGRFAKKDAESPEGGASPALESSALVPATELGPEATKRVADLRQGAQALIEQSMWRQAFPLLCEIAALSPHDEWALQRLAEYYRRDGEEPLAREIEKRRRPTSG